VLMNWPTIAVQTDEANGTRLHAARTAR